MLLDGNSGAKLGGLFIRYGVIRYWKFRAESRRRELRKKNQLQVHFHNSEDQERFGSVLLHVCMQANRNRLEEILNESAENRSVCTEQKTGNVSFVEEN